MAQSSQHDDAPGHDSFLDIVANMVGILIILVMVVGVRIKNAPLTVAQAQRHAEAALQPSTSTPKSDAQRKAELADLKAKLGNVRATDIKVYSEVAQLATTLENLGQAIELQRRQRQMLLTTVAIVEEAMRRERMEMNEQTRDSFDHAREIDRLEKELEKLASQQRALDSLKTTPKIITNKPTPIASSSVEENELFFQLKGGRLTFIPIRRLMELRNEAFSRNYELARRNGELTETVGPIGGFKLTSTLYHQGGMPVARWVILPQSEHLGESLDTIIDPRSELQEVLRNARPGRDSITIWTYPDSFNEFRKIQELFSEKGFAVAARPLPDGIRIGGSPLGTKTVTQ